MNETNYQSEEPQELSEINEETHQVLAHRSTRLGASILDAIIMMLFIFSAIYLTGGFERLAAEAQPDLFYDTMLGVLGLIFFLLINFKLLKDKGQTIGKKIVGIKIVGMDGNQATWKQHLNKRYATFYLPNFIPIAGDIFSIVNVLFIFGKEKRCVHDYAGGTKVINC